MFSGTWAPFFLDPCFLDLWAGFFVGPGGTKNWGTCLCVFWTLWGYVFRPACICAVPRESQITCFWPRFIFGPVHLHRGPCLHRVGGGNSIVIGAQHWAWCFWPLAPSFFEPVHFFWTWHRWVEEEFWYWDKMPCKKLLMQGRFGYWNNKERKKVVERPMGEVYVWSEMDAGNWEAYRGKGKFDIEKGWSLDIETEWRYMKIHAKTCWETQGWKFWDQQMNVGSCWEAQGGGI